MIEEGSRFTRTWFFNIMQFDMLKNNCNVGIKPQSSELRLQRQQWRELGLHHPRATSSKFVTVTVDVAVAEPAGESRDAGDFLDELLDRVAE